MKCAQFKLGQIWFYGPHMTTVTFNRPADPFKSTFLGLRVLKNCLPQFTPLSTWLMPPVHFKWVATKYVTYAPS